jgi:hypothetical protein
MEVRGTLPPLVNLSDEIIEHADVMAVLKQGVGEVRADESGAAGNQDAHHVSWATPTAARHEPRGPL